MASLKTLNKMEEAFAKANGTAPVPHTEESIKPRKADGSFMRRALLTPLVGPVFAGRIADMLGGTKIDSAIQGAGQGLMLGASDEAGALAQGVGSWITGNGYTKRHDQALKENRDMLAAAQKRSPVAYGGGEVAGSALLSAVAPEVGGPAVSIMGSAAKQAIPAAVQAGLTAFGEGKNSARERLSDAIPAAAIGGVLGGTLAAGGHVVGKFLHGGKGTLPAHKEFVDARNAAYQAVKDSKATVSGMDAEKVFLDARQHIIDDYIYNPRSKTDEPTKDALNHMFKNIRTKTKSGYVYKDLTVGELDKVKQDILRKRSGNGAQDAKLIALSKFVDDAIALVPEGKKLIDAARFANQTEKQLKTLSKIITKTDNAASGQGMGANYSAGLKRRMAKLLENEKEMKYFTDEQRKVMQAIVDDAHPDKITEWIGKFAPTGSGMTQGLLLLGAATNPLVGVVAGAGGIARATANKTARDQAVNMINQFAKKPVTPPYSRGTSPAVTAIAAQAGPTMARAAGLDPLFMLTNNVQGGNSTTNTLLDEAFKRQRQPQGPVQ